MPGMMDWQKLIRVLTAGLLVLLLTFSPITTQPSLAIRKGRAAAPESSQATAQASGKLAETAPPEILQALRQDLEKYQPQVKIVSPRSQEVLTDTRVAVQFQVTDLPIFKDKTLGLGPHLHVLLDNRTYQAVYDISQPLVFENLEPGTHTLRAFASRPWHESFKNEGAYAQTTFHILTKTQENSPDPKLPLLTYSRPQGSYGAEPILLDFYLTNAPLHLVAREDKKDDITDWRIRCTVNGKSFLLDQWQPVYLKGFKPGKNWVQLEFLDEDGKLVPNVFNNTARIITYEPGGQDSLAKLVRGELSLEEARSIVDPNYKPAPKPLPTPSPEPIETPIVKPSPVPIPSPVSPPPTVKATPGPEPSVSPSPVIAPVPIAPAKPEMKVPQIEASPVSTPAPAKTPEVRPTATPAVKETPRDRPKLETEQPEPVPSPAAEEPAAKAEPPKPSPQETITNFLNRFRPQARSTKPAAPPPSSVPSVSPSPLPTTTPEAIKGPESVPEPEKSETPAPVRVTPQPIAAPQPTVTPKVIERPQPTVTPKPEVTRSPIVAPKAESPAPGVSKSVATERDRESSTPIAPPQPSVKPTPVPSPSPFSAKTISPSPVKSPVKPDLSSPKSAQEVEKVTSSQPAPAFSSDIQEQAKPEGSKALTEIQGKVTEKAAELRSEFTAQFKKLRDRLRRPAPSEVTQPAPKLSAPETTTVPAPDVPAEIKTPATLTAPAPPEPVAPTSPD